MSAKIFVSYSWVDDEHADGMLDTVSKIMKTFERDIKHDIPNIEIIQDKYTLEQGSIIPKTIIDHIKSSDFLLFF